MNSLQKITLDGIEYVRADSVGEKALPGKRYVVVLDRGWVVAGDVETTPNGRLRITRALHIRNWLEIGFDGMVADPKSKKVIIRPMPNGFDCPADAELFRVPVNDTWGL